VKRKLKPILGFLAYRTGVYRYFFRNKALVVLFHRVDDRLKGNPLACTTGEFEAFCDFFSRYFRVVSVEALLRRLAAGSDVSRHLVITFDDGYKDNHDVAAVVLRRRGLPACFFVATDFIESEIVAWWDVERGEGSPWMSWEDVRALEKDGFEIGSHTMSHPDLGVVSREEAMAELSGSRERLSRELGAIPVYFSYPYGRREQITEANRDAVRETGFRCCMSAYGGAVDSNTDPFRIKRYPIGPAHRSPWHFAVEALFARP